MNWDKKARLVLSKVFFGGDGGGGGGGGGEPNDGQSFGGNTTGNFGGMSGMSGNAAAAAEAGNLAAALGIGNAGTIGGGGHGGTGSATGGSPGTTGNFSGAATGFGQDGYGVPADGQPGIFGGGVLGGIPGTPAPETGSNESIDAALAAAFSDDGQLNSTIATDIDMAEAESFMGKTAIAIAHFGEFFGTNEGKALDAGLSVLGMPVSGAIVAAGIGAALSGTVGMSDDGQDAISGNFGGQSFSSLVDSGNEHMLNTNTTIGDYMSAPGEHQNSASSEEQGDIDSYLPGTTLGEENTSSTEQDSIGQDSETSGGDSQVATGDIWNDYVDSWYDREGGMEASVLADADHNRQAAEQYQSTISGANDKQTAIVDDILNKVENEEGIYKPTTFTIQGQPVSFVNKGARNTGNFVIDAGQKAFQNAGTTATGLLGTSALTSPESGNLAYMDRLSGFAKDAEEIRAQDVYAKYRQDALARNIAVDGQNYSINQQKIDQSEPSYLQQAGELVNVGKGVFDLFDLF